uniref:Uncharacterized protein n=1 Tax=Caenorhabditis tropicalis TaxID=1561998 RepID=A0A1I7TI06_9PELO
MPVLNESPTATQDVPKETYLDNASTFKLGANAINHDITDFEIGKSLTSFIASREVMHGAPSLRTKALLQPRSIEPDTRRASGASRMFLGQLFSLLFSRVRMVVVAVRWFLHLFPQPRLF